LTAALFGEITIKNGRVEQSNFHDYRMLRINEVRRSRCISFPVRSIPAASVRPGDCRPAGSDNALYAATGIRLRRLPIDRDVLAGKKPA